MHAHTTLSHRFLWLQSLHPGNFAMVMASGIVSLGLTILGPRVLTQRPKGDGVMRMVWSWVAWRTPLNRIRVAFAAWIGTFFALLRRLWRAVPGIFQPA